jgi:hypothetical protein
VNAPFACPKSSLSRSPSGIAPQFTSQNGPPRRDASWRIRAIIDLPVPDSPVTRTVARVAATDSIVSTSLLNAESVPIIFGPCFFFSRAARSSAFSDRSRACSRARSTTISISSSFTGFVT